MSDITKKSLSELVKDIKDKKSKQYKKAMKLSGEASKHRWGARRSIKKINKLMDELKVLNALKV